MVEAAVDLCTSFLCSPEGPSTPFGTPFLFIVDVLRVFMVLVGLATAAYMPYAVATAGSIWQRLRFVALGLLCVIIGATQFEHLGDYPYYRTFLSLIAMVCTAAGMYGYHRDARRYEEDEILRDRFR